MAETPPPEIVALVKAFLYTLHPDKNKVVRAQLFPNAEAAIDHTAAATHRGPSDLV